MRYQNIQVGIFLERPNRFVAHVRLLNSRETVICHVKNTGRCRELLRTGAVVYLQEADNSLRKTRWDLIAVEKGDRLINMDSMAPNKTVKEFLPKLFPDLRLLRTETKFGSSRFDFYGERDSGERFFLEVKGVTLEQDGICRFPDAPTLRGSRHLEELRLAKEGGYEAYVFFVIQMKDIRFFTPNRDTDPLFTATLTKAAKDGVHLLAYDCEVTADSMTIRSPIPVKLGEENYQERDKV